MALDGSHAPGATPLDPDELEALIPEHISTQSELNAWEQRNIIGGQEWALRSRGATPDYLLSDHYVRQLHNKMFGSTWRWAGQYRRSEKNLGIDWMQIPEQVRNACEDAKLWVSDEVFEPRELAIRFHHRLVFIHPFANGNGRHTRLMADLLLIKYFKLERLSWGNRDLVSSGEARNQYLKSLREADKGSFDALIDFATNA
jgi:Fic-DOC domain mobile mystery protein B